MHHTAAGLPPVMNRSHVVLALAAGLAGLVIGRVMPPGAPSPDTEGRVAPTAPVTASECKADRVQLASTRVQLAICMAYRAPSSEPAPASSSPEPPAPAHPPQGLAGFEAWAQARKPNERLENYPEAVLVRRADGTRAIYRPDEHSPDSDDVYARKSLDGNIAYYLGPDAGPRSDPDAWGRFEDLADPDGWVVMNGKRLIRLGRPDAGAP